MRRGVVISCSGFGVELFHQRHLLLSVPVQVSIYVCVCMFMCVRAVRHLEVRHAATVCSRCECALPSPFVSFLPRSLRHCRDGKEG